MTNKKNECTRILRVILTDAQRLELGKKLAEEHNTVAQTNADFDRVKAEFKSKLTASEARIVDLSGKVSSGYEMKDVKCEWQMDTPKPGTKRLIRTDVAPNSPESAIVEVEECDMEEIEKTPELPLPFGTPVLPATTGVAKDGSVTTPADGAATAGEQK